MGIWERPSNEFIDGLESAVGTSLPREQGLDTVAAIEAMQEGNIKVFFAMGGNLLSAAPDTLATGAAIEKCRLSVQVSTKLNRSHLACGERALILPCLGRTEVDRSGGAEQFVTTENSMGVVQTSRGHLKPASDQLKSEVEIVTSLAAELATRPRTEKKMSQVNWRELGEDYSRIRSLIERSIPGFENYEERVQQQGGFSLPNPVRDSLEFKTESGKAQFTTHKIPKRELTEGEFLLMTMRSHDQYNTTIYGLDDRYRGVRGGRKVLFIHPSDLEANALKSGDIVDITSHFRGEQRTARGFRLVSYPIARGCLGAYFPETNLLVPLGQKAHGSHTPASKSILVTLS